MMMAILTIMMMSMMTMTMMVMMIGTVHSHPLSHCHGDQYDDVEKAFLDYDKSSCASLPPTHSIGRSECNHQGERVMLDDDNNDDGVMLNLGNNSFVLQENLISIHDQDNDQSR